jgi:hypothetical protein
MCVVVHKYIYRNVYPVLYYYGDSKLFNLSTVCGEIRQTLDAKMRQLFQFLFQLPCVQVICGSLQYLQKCLSFVILEC